MEIWENIEGYEGKYKVSNTARVMSVYDPNRHSFKKEREIMQSLGGKGYPYVTLYKDGKPTTKLIHRLVGKAFIPNPDNKPQINHINGIKTDNRIENLEWCTLSENQLHAVATGLKPSGGLHVQAKVIIQKDKNGNIVKEWGAINEAARFLGVTKQSINYSLQSKRTDGFGLAHGFKWEYKL